MSKESHLELKVGIFVFVALALLTIFIFSINDTSVFKEGKSYEVIFGFANGVKKSAPVRIAGVDQGMVKDIQLFFDHQDGKTKVKIGLWIQEDIKIPSDSIVVINQLGLMGEKYIEIKPGIDTRDFIKERDIIVGKDPIAQEAMSEKFMQVAKKLDTAIDGLSKILEDEGNVSSIHQTLENLSNMTASLREVLSDVKSGQGTVGKLLYDERLYNDLQELSADLKANPWKLLYRPKKEKKY